MLPFVDSTPLTKEIDQDLRFICVWLQSSTDGRIIQKQLIETGSCFYSLTISASEKSSSLLYDTHSFT